MGVWQLIFLAVVGFWNVLIAVKYTIIFLETKKFESFFYKDDAPFMSSYYLAAYAYLRFAFGLPILWLGCQVYRKKGAGNVGFVISAMNTYVVKSTGFLAFLIYQLLTSKDDNLNEEMMAHTLIQSCLFFFDFYSSIKIRKMAKIHQENDLHME